MHIFTLHNAQKNWSEKCSMAEFAINSSINTTTGYAPLKLNYGYMPATIWTAYIHEDHIQRC